MEYLRAFFAFVAAHPAESWGFATTVINTLLALVPPDRLVAWCERHERGARFIGAVRRWGINPEGFIRWLQLAVATKAAQASAAALPSSGDSLPPPPGGA